MHIAVLPGDGIGKEVTAQAVKVLRAVVGSEADFTQGLIGGAAVQAVGVPLPPETFELAKKADAILFGASSLKPELVEGLDLIILRELNGDIYYGEPRGITTDSDGVRHGVNTMCYSFGRKADAERIEHAVRAVLAKGLRTRDILQPGTAKLGTAAMGDAVLAALT